MRGQRRRLVTAPRPGAPADIFERVRAVLPGVAFATVYNALHALASHGIILQLSFGDHASRFDGRVDRHDHVLCTRCGELADAVAPPSPAVVEEAAAATGFEIHAYHTQLLGICAACQDTGPARAAVSHHESR